MTRLKLSGAMKSISIDDRAEMTPDERAALAIRSYLLWSHEHRAWWAPNSSGYTKEIAHAGRYTREEAADVVLDTIPPGQEIAIERRFAAMAQPRLELIAALMRQGGVA